MTRSVDGRGNGGRFIPPASSFSTLQPLKDHWWSVKNSHKKACGRAWEKRCNEWIKEERVEGIWYQNCVWVGHFGSHFLCLSQLEAYVSLGSCRLIPNSSVSQWESKGKVLLIKFHRWLFPNMLLCNSPQQGPDVWTYSLFSMVVRRDIRIIMLYIVSNNTTGSPDNENTLQYITNSFFILWLFNRALHWSYAWEKALFEATWLPCSSTWGPAPSTNGFNTHRRGLKKYRAL